MSPDLNPRRQLLALNLVTFGINLLPFIEIDGIRHLQEMTRRICTDRAVSAAEEKYNAAVAAAAAAASPSNQ